MILNNLTAGVPRSDIGEKRQPASLQSLSTFYMAQVVLWKANPTKKHADDMSFYQARENLRG